MASAPNPATTHVVTLNDMGWNTKLLVPSSLLTKFSELMSLCSIVEVDYLSGSCETVAVLGDVEFSTSTVGKSRVLCESKAQAKEFKAFHDATYEMTPFEDRVSGRPAVTLEEFKGSLMASTKDEISYARPS